MMGTWMQCQLQARFQYVDRLPRESNAYMSFGSCVHHALEVYNSTTDVEVAVGAFRAAWKDPETIGAGFTFWPKTTAGFGPMMVAGTEMIRAYHEKQRWEKRRVLAAEHRFLVPFGEHELTGSVDLLEVKKSSKGREVMRVVDYKTGSRQPISSELRLNTQFTAYVFASTQQEFWLGNGNDFPAMANGEFYWETMRDLPRRAIWYHLKANREVDAGERDDRDFMRLYRVVEQMERALKAEVFMPNISGSTCPTCPFVEPCGLHIPTVEEMREQETAF